MIDFCPNWRLQWDWKSFVKLIPSCAKTLQEYLHLLSRCWPKKLLEKVGGRALWEKEGSEKDLPFLLSKAASPGPSVQRRAKVRLEDAPNRHRPQQGFQFRFHPPLSRKEFWPLISYIFCRSRNAQKRLFDPVERDMFGCGLGWYKGGRAHPPELVGRQRAS